MRTTLKRRTVRELHNDELYNLYQLKEDNMGKAFRMQGENRNVYRLLLGKPEGIRLLESDRCRRRIVLKCVLEK
jgi:hypothetical protein